MYDADEVERISLGSMELARVYEGVMVVEMRVRLKAKVWGHARLVVARLFLGRTRHISDNHAIVIDLVDFFGKV